MLILLVSTTAMAQEASVPRPKRVVDEVTLTTGEKIYGIVTDHHKRTGTTVLVERAWLKKKFPGIYAKQVASEQKVFATFSQQHLERLKDWKGQRPDEKQLNIFLDEEIEYLEEAVKDDDASKDTSVFEDRRFTKVKLEASEVTHARSRPDDHHQIAGLAWKYQLKDVSTRSISDLKDALMELDVDISKDTFDLSVDLPPTGLESVDDWNARIGLFEYIYLEPQHYQGTGSMLIKVGRDKQAAPEDLLTMMMGGGGLGALGGLGGSSELIDELLEDLRPGGPRRRKQRADEQPSQPEEEDISWAKSALDEAQKAGHRAVRITRLTQNMSAPVAKVDEYLFAEIRPGEWKAVFTASATSNRNEVEQAEVDFLKQDPQIERITKLFSALGTGDDKLLDTALRQGAATQQAMTKSSTKFSEFIHKYTQRTDGPVMPKTQ